MNTKVINFLITMFLKKCVNKIFLIAMCLTSNEDIIKVFYIITLYSV